MDKDNPLYGQRREGIGTTPSRQNKASNNKPLSASSLEALEISEEELAEELRQRGWLVVEPNEHLWSGWDTGSDDQCLLCGVSAQDIGQPCSH
jgi:hypothetical protein